MQMDLTTQQNNDTTFTFSLTNLMVNSSPDSYNSNAPDDYSAFNLTGYTAEAFLKASQTTPDIDGVSFTVTIVTPLLGAISWAVPRADVSVAGAFWYRIDLTNTGTGLIETAVFGNFTVLAA
jgi:hypothetical protein